MDPTRLSTVALTGAVATVAPLLSEATGRKVPSVVLAGYEIEFAQIRGRPLELPGIGWFVSLVIAISIAGGLVFTTHPVWFVHPRDWRRRRVPSHRGLVVRLANHGEQSHVIEQKLSSVAFGVFVPIFFVVSGMSFDLDALMKDPVTILRMPLFLGLFLLVRGIPVLLLYRGTLTRAQRLPMVLLSATALPIVVAITEIGLDTGRMKPQNAAALVGAVHVATPPPRCGRAGHRQYRPTSPPTSTMTRPTHDGSAEPLLI